MCLCSFLPGEGSTGLRICHSPYPVTAFPPFSPGDGLPDYLQLTMGNSVGYFLGQKKTSGLSEVLYLLFIAVTIIIKNGNLGNTKVIIFVLFRSVILSTCVSVNYLKKCFTLT